MSLLTLKKPLFFPRCLVCSRVLWLRRGSSRKKKTIECSKCGIAYSRTAIKDADPERWNRVRMRSLYKVKFDRIGRPILYINGLGSRRRG